MNTKTNFTHWTFEVDEAHIVTLCLDRADARVNTLNEAVLMELDQALDIIMDPAVKPQDDNDNTTSFPEKAGDSGAQIASAPKGRTPYKGLIITSKKSTGFIAGADIEQFKAFKDSDEAFTLIRRGQQLFSKLEALPIPSVAAIQGFCLGGGLELSLACTYRVAEASPKTRLGLPEVMLGIHPGWGGMVRLPRLIGGLRAMDLILTGRTVDGEQAYRLGMVDEAVPERLLMRAARMMILAPSKRRSLPWVHRLSNVSWARALLAKAMRKKVLAKASPKHYPAPFAAIKQWKAYGVTGEKAYIQEAKSVVKLFQTDAAKNLLRVFFLQTQLKDLSRDKNFHVGHVHVIGAGTMGGDIAAWCAYKGMRVTLQDRGMEYIAPALKRAHQLFQKKCKKPHLIQAAHDRLLPDVEGHGVAKADVIIEAIYESVEAKQNVFQSLINRMKPNAILATNTSSIPLDDIARVLPDPSRLVGIHFFNPVSKMQLVEVVKGKETSDAVVKQAIQFVRLIDRLPLPVKSSPGFLVNRILMPYLLESVAMLDAGIPKTAIDKAAKDFGMPMGPVELADVVGLDVCLSIADFLKDVFGYQIPNVLKEKVEQKQLGQKTGQGFYRYHHGKRVSEKENLQGVNLKDIQTRLVDAMLNESEKCLKEGIVESPDLLDAGMIFGTGFAPFRGGPMHYASQL